MTSGMSTAGMRVVALLMVFGLVVLQGCDEDGSSSGGYSGQPDIAFTNVAITTTEARNGQDLKVTWGYSGAGTLKKQFVEFLWWDCTGMQTSTAEISRSSRSYAFKFRRPVTVHVIAETSRGTTDFAIDVHRDSLQHFEINDVYNSAPELFNTGNPALSTGRNRRYDRVNPQIRFDNMMAWMDGNGNGFIDLMAEDATDLGLPVTEDFFMHTVGRVAQSCDGGWGCMSYTMGSAYPAITDGLRNDANVLGLYPEELPEALTHSNVMIFAATIVNDGMVLRARDEKNQVVLARQNITRFDTLFCAVEAVGSSGRGWFNDIALGNIRQGMVATAFRAKLRHAHVGVTMKLHAAYNDPQSPQKGGFLEGHNYEAIVAVPVVGARLDNAAKKAMDFNPSETLTGVYVRLGKFGNDSKSGTGLVYSTDFFYDDDARFDLCAIAGG